MPRKSKYPCMLYACACVGMRTMRGDAANSNCKDCHNRGTVELVVKDGKEEPNCSTCLCPIIIGQFIKKDTQAIAIHAAEKSTLKQRKVNPQAKAIGALGQMIAGSVMGAIGRLGTNPLVNLLLVTASNLSRKEMDKDDRHVLQQIVPAPGTKLSGGEDIRSVLVNHNFKGKRHYANRFGQEPIDLCNNSSHEADEDNPKYWKQQFSDDALHPFLLRTDPATKKAKYL